MIFHAFRVLYAVVEMWKCGIFGGLDWIDRDCQRANQTTAHDIEGLTEGVQIRGVKTHIPVEQRQCCITPLIAAKKASYRQGFVWFAEIISAASNRSLKVLLCGWPDMLGLASRQVSVDSLASCSQEDWNFCTLRSLTYLA